MSNLEFTIGAQVHCRDGRCGHVLKLLVDPREQEVTGLVVEKGLLQKVDAVIPVSLVQRATERDVYLSVDSDRLAALPAYHEETYSEPAPGYRDGEPGAKAARAEALALDGASLLYGFGAGIPMPVIPMIRKHVRKGIPEGAAVIGRGALVSNVEGHIGKVDHVLVDPTTDEITHLVVDRRPLSHAVIVPAVCITEVDDEQIFVDLNRMELDGLPRYVPRAEAEIRAELRTRLQAISGELHDVKATVENGVLRLAGVVPDVRAKRSAEAAARGIAGVVDVDNKLDTDTAIVARVTSALACDPRTELAVIEVIGESGLVTLKGQVDSDEIGAAAAEVAGRQPGVLRVIAALEVGADDDTVYLVYRSLPVEPADEAGALKKQED